MPEGSPEKRKKIKEMEVMVADVVAETPDTTTLVLFTGNDQLEYKAGHFLTIHPKQFEALERFTSFLEDLKGKKEPARAYSLSSSPHEKHLAITVKEERYVSGATRYPPLLSPMLVKRILRGMRFVITGFTGPYTLPEDVESRTDHVVHLCAGSGSVPNYSILKWALVHHPRIRHTFVYSNRHWRDIIFRDALRALETQHPESLRVIHTLTREKDAGLLHSGVRMGRLNAALLREVLPHPQSALYYVCGPAISHWDRLAARERGTQPQPRFFESAMAALGELSVPGENIRYETYG